MRKAIAAITLFFMTIFICTGTPQVATASLRTIYVSNATELQNALKNAVAGDEIVIAAGTYVGNKSTSGNSNAHFYSGKSGTSENPIIVRSEDPNNPAILSGSSTGSAYVLYITGDYWEIKDLKITNAKKGIMLDNANYNYIFQVEVYNIGEEGIHLRDGSSNNTLKRCYVHDTGKVNPQYGEGIYVGSDKGKWDQFVKECDNNKIDICTIGPNVTAEHVDIKEGTTGTIVQKCIMDGTGISGANYADSFIDVKGNDSYIRYNTCYRNGNSNIADAFQVHQQVSGWGLNNRFYENTCYLDTSAPYVVNVASGSARVSANTRYPSGNMYRGNYTEY